MGDCRGATRVGASFAREFPDARPSATECHQNLIRTGLLAQSRVADILRPFGLSGTAFNVLAIVGGAGEPLSPCKLSERAVVPRNTLTHLLDVLERDGLVRRERHPHHRGMLLIEITDAGRQVLGDVLPRLHRLEAAWWSGFSEDERQALIALLGRAQDALVGACDSAGG